MADRGVVASLVVLTRIIALVAKRLPPEEIERFKADLQGEFLRTSAESDAYIVRWLLAMLDERSDYPPR